MDRVDGRGLVVGDMILMMCIMFFFHLVVPGGLQFSECFKILIDGLSLNMINVESIIWIAIPLDIDIDFALLLSLFIGLVDYLWFD